MKTVYLSPVERHVVEDRPPRHSPRTSSRFFGSNTPCLFGLLAHIRLHRYVLIF